MISGSSFGSSRGIGTVSIGGTNALVTSWSDTQVFATVRASAVTGVAKIESSVKKTETANS